MAKLDLKRKEGAGDGVRRVALGRVAAALDELSSASRNGDLASSIHAARKELKKLRAVLRLVRGELGEDLYRAENRRYRNAARLLARSRDAEVKLETLSALEERFGKTMPPQPVREWCLALEADRDELGGERATARVERAIAEIGAGRESIAAWPGLGDGWKPIAAGLRDGYRRGRREMRRVRADPSAERVHEWRKRVKDLWYQLRLLRGAWPAVLDPAAEQAHALADLLGDHHDLTVLGEDLAARPAVGEREALAGLIERRQGELLGEAIGLGELLYAEKPKAFERRLRSYWSAWRDGRVGVRVSSRSAAAGIRRPASGSSPGRPAAARRRRARP